MLQESELKRLVFSLQINYHFVDHVECGYGIDIKIFYPSLDRSVVFRGHSKLTNWIARKRASRDWAAGRDVSWFATVEA